MTWRSSPILITRNPERTLAFYRALGFRLRGHNREPGAQYLLLEREGVDLHFTQVPGDYAGLTDTATYLHVDDAAAVHREWSSALALPESGKPRLVAPQPQPWGYLEGHLVDPDGHLLRFGSPLPRAD